MTMKKRLFLTVESDHHSEKLELQNDIQIRKLLPIILKTLQLDINGEGTNSTCYHLFAIIDGNEIELKNSDTLSEIEISSGDRIKIIKSVRYEIGTNEQETIGIPRSPDSDFSNYDEIDIMQQVDPLKIEINGPSLVDFMGNIYEIPQKTIRIGRPSKKEKPDINLSGLEDDPKHPVSGRKHAEINYQNGTYLIRSYPTLNGTYLNGNEVPPNQNRALKEGDLLQFGDVKLIFRSP